MFFSCKIKLQLYLNKCTKIRFFFEIYYTKIVYGLPLEKVLQSRISLSLTVHGFKSKYLASISLLLTVHSLHLTA